MRAKSTFILLLAAVVVILIAVIPITRNSNRTNSQTPTPLPTEFSNSQISVSWEEGKKLINGCKVHQTTELHSGILRLELTSGPTKTIKPYNRDELYELVQKVPAKCGFAITLAIE